jgi:Domain of unknown function (DUF6457)
MTAEEWIRTFAEQLGSAPPTQDEMDEVLRLAAIAAHASERIAAPIACWLVGRAGKPLEEAIETADAIGGSDGP